MHMLTIQRRRFRGQRWLRLAAAAGLFLGVALLLAVLVMLARQWAGHGVTLNLPIALLAFALGLTYWALGGAAWWGTLRVLSGGTGGPHPHLQPTLQVFFVGNVGRYLPGKLWYAAGRAYLADRLGMDRATVAASTLLELAFIGTSGALITLAGAPFLATASPNAAWFGAVSLMVGLLALHPRCFGLVLAAAARLRGTTPPPAPPYRSMLCLLAAYVGVWLVGGLTLFVTLAALTPVSWTQLPAVIGVWGIAYLAGFVAPLTPAGLGVREATASALLATLVSVPAAVAAALAFRLIMTAAEAVLVLPIVWRLRVSGFSFSAGDSDRAPRVPEPEPMKWGTLPDLIGPRHVYRVRRMAVWLRDAVPPGVGSQPGYVLDAGCGAGRLTEMLARRGYRVLAVDGSAEFVAHVQARVARAGLADTVEVRQVDLAAPDFPPAAFDGVVSGEVLEHVPDDNRAVRALAATLKPGGTLILSVPAGKARYDWLDRWAGHERRYEEAEIRDTLSRAGLEVERLVRWGFPFMMLYERFVQRPGLARVGHQGGEASPLARLARSRPTTALLGALFRLDERFEGSGRGTGFLVRARKP